MEEIQSIRQQILHFIMEKLIIIGTSSTARHAYSFVQYHHLFDVIGFAVHKDYLIQSSFCGLPVYPLEQLEMSLPLNDYSLFIAMLWNHLNADRRRVYDYCSSRGFHLANLVSPLAIVRGTINGDNCWIHDNVVIQNDTIINSNTAIMQGSLVGSDCIIGAHCFLGAHSIVAGGCSIGEQSFVGLHATVFDDTHVGRKCIIGACTAVKRNVPDFTKYTSSSDSIVIKQYDEEVIESKLVFSKNVR